MATPENQQAQKVPWVPFNDSRVWGSSLGVKVPESHIGTKNLHLVLGGGCMVCGSSSRCANSWPICEDMFGPLVPDFSRKATEAMKASQTAARGALSLGSFEDSTGGVIAGASESLAPNALKPINPKLCPKP